MTQTRRTSRTGPTTSLVLVALAVVLAATACSKETPRDTGAGAPSGAATGSTAAGAGATTAPTRAAGPSTKYAGFSDPTYAKGENWLCGPGAASDDRCLRADLDVTVVKADGTTEIKRSTPIAQPEFDCFYVYPTVNLATTLLSDETMATDTAVEDAVTRAQASRFREVCRVFAPLYRQITIAGYGSSERERLLGIAYGDVRNAFKHYMSKWNDGRPVLLVGHSQGSGHLDRLLRDEFDADEQMRAQLVSAMLIGGSSTVAPGSDVGGSFANIPACRAPDQRSCVVGFNSVAADTPPEEMTRWGSAGEGKQKLCTNPGSLANGTGTLTPIMADQATKYTTPWVAYPGALTATCQSSDGTSTLKIVGTPGDTRVAPEQIKSVPGWGLHINEVNLTHGDLIELARTQGAAATG